ncbi:MAG: hypothetical protein JST75_19315 [Bacteroidetes bacterium]|nr:hypothetical protein [Bacteroidota bacterium]
MSEGKFITLWTKYLPIIRILLKNSLSGEKQTSLGKMELRSVDNRKNANYSFALEIKNGKVQNRIMIADIGKDLYTVLSNDSIAVDFMKDKIILISMGRSSMLTLKSSFVGESEIIPSDENTNSETQP